MEAVKDPESSGPVDVQTDTSQMEPQTEPTDLSLEQSGSDDLLIAEVVTEPPPESSDSAALKAIIEAAIYVTDEPLTPEQISLAIEQPLLVVNDILQQLAAEYAAPGRGLAVREVAGGYKMATKPEYHESIRRFVKRLQPPLKLSLAALETLAVVAYKQPITGPEILDIRGVQGAGVLKTLLDRRLIATAGRKNVMGKPMMYKTTREFLIQFGLDSLAELPTLKEFEELGRLALTDEEVTPSSEPVAASQEKQTTTVAAEPTVESAEPTAEDVGPLVESVEPATEHAEPGTENPLPETTDSELAENSNGDQHEASQASEAVETSESVPHAGANEEETDA